jgi:hypothetical protein
MDAVELSQAILFGKRAGDSFELLVFDGEITSLHRSATTPCDTSAFPPDSDTSAHPIRSARGRIGHAARHIAAELNNYHNGA